ncbi:signal peptidase I [Humidesulfovibrio mexicanus]|jgi:signal peptidase I|uniref:Signal peptidase I n=1 Tax=Humidesulfovibrio mexicanus TaxID=147047 RepID=A0A239AMI2_9BACT|nr:signal peptidase I [Humidesulfovibrio mexicanus]SNR96885.1 signal peptidase I [Humidesulfovibrio mexicanus]
MHVTVLPRRDGGSAGPPSSPRKPWLAALASFLLPGLGQLYNGRFRKGAGLLCLAAAWQLLGIGAVETFRWWLSSLAGYLLLSLYAAWEALRTARRLTHFVPGPRNSLPVYLGAVALMATAAIAAGQAERWAFPIFAVAQTSMRPTLRSGDRLRCQALRPRDIVRRGQLVVFEYPSEHSLIFVKRVVGLPGEVVEVADGSVYVNGDPIDEGYYAMRGPGRKSLDMPPARLAPDEYYVMGDNRYASFDSRSFGPVNRARMLATPLYVIFSRDDFGRVYWDRIGLPAR